MREIRAEGDCWVWTGSRNGAGYGTVTIDGRSDFAHRLAWTLTYGRIPPGKRVLHRCDNPPCVRPSHLFLGTQSENLIDAVTKGRGGTAKLTVSDILTIRDLLAEGLSQQAVADRFHVSQVTISLVHRGRTWSHADRHPQEVPTGEIPF